MGLTLIGIIAGAAIVTVAVLTLILLIMFRVVVPTDEVHIVQSAKETISYGKDYDSKAYYKWPSSWPKLGVTVKKMSVSNFDNSLKGYTAYDIDRVPFKVDITAFFCIEDTNIAAQRISNERELEEHLRAIVQGAVRTVLAGYTIDEIMTKRDTFGISFTDQVTDGLKSWGLKPVKNLELMDIRDADDSEVIHNIMAKKKSFIEMESRQAVAQNNKNAELKEIEAEREVEIQRQQKEQAIGERTAEKEKSVGIANETAQQEIKEAQAVTAEKDMAVKRVNDVKQAEIAVDVAEQNKKAAEINAAASLAEGKAEAEVRKAMFEADNALELKLNTQKETAIGVAKALADAGVDLVPSTYIGGGQDSTVPNATETLTQLMTVAIANNQNMNEVTKNNETTKEEQTTIQAKAQIDA